MAELSEELQECFVAVTKLRTYLAADSKGTAHVEDALKKLCRYYNSDQIARAGKYVIENVLSQQARQPSGL